jgi:hypothetical protein
LKKQIDDAPKSSPNSPEGRSNPNAVSKGAKGAPSNIENPHIVIDVDYSGTEYSPLPIDFLRKNSEGKTYIIFDIGLVNFFIMPNNRRNDKSFKSSA